MALGDDATAEPATGGLTLKRTDVIEMDSEDLFISTRQIRVRCRFINPTSASVTTIVAFPTPDIDVGGPDGNLSLPVDAPANFLDVHMKANGRAVEAQAEQNVTAESDPHMLILKTTKFD